MKLYRLILLPLLLCSCSGLFINSGSYSLNSSLPTSSLTTSYYSSEEIDDSQISHYPTEVLIFNKSYDEVKLILVSLSYYVNAYYDYEVGYLEVRYSDWFGITVDVTGNVTAYLETPYGPIAVFMFLLASDSDAILLSDALFTNYGHACYVMRSGPTVIQTWAYQPELFSRLIINNFVPPVTD